MQEVTIPSLDHVRAANSVIMVSEAFAYHEPNLKTRPQEFGEIVRGRFRIGGMMSAVGLPPGAAGAHLGAAGLSPEVMKTVDFLVTPHHDPAGGGIRRLRSEQHGPGPQLHRSVQRHRIAGHLGPVWVH